MKHAILFFLALATFQFATPQSVAVRHLVPPPYPTMAITARVQADVIAQVTVTPAGTVKDVTIQSGHPMLNQAVIDSLKQWTFTCSGCSGQEYVEKIRVRFVLNDEQCDYCVRYVLDLPDSVEVYSTPRVVTIE